MITHGKVMNVRRLSASIAEWENQSSEKLSRRMTSLHGPVETVLRKELTHFGEHGQHFDFVEEALRRLHVHELANAVGDFVEFVDFKSEIHAAGGAELIDQNLRAGVALDVLEKQRRAAGCGRPASIIFADAIGYFGDLENGIDFGTDLF